MQGPSTTTASAFVVMDCRGARCVLRTARTPRNDKEDLGPKETVLLEFSSKTVKVAEPWLQRYHSTF